MTATRIPADRIGPYLLHGLIGRGGMGEVHRAVDTAHHGRMVALKLLPPDLAADPERRARFETESRIVAALDGPHVIDVHTYGEIEGRLFLDMQLVDGPDLATYLMGTGPLPADLAVTIVEQVASALDAAHARGLVHHDVKPSNILLHTPVVGRPPHAVLADFGIAGDATGFGTVEYLAPERLRGAPGDQRVDVYALTCVLHELLTGTRAFPGAEFAAQMHGHLRRPPPRPSAFVTGLPPELDDVVAAGMAKDPDARIASAGELGRRARAALAGRPRPGLSRRTLLVGAAAGVVTLGGGLAVAGSVRGGSGTFPAGSPPARVVADRVLGIRSTDPIPFTLGRVGGSVVAVVLGSDSVQAWDLVTDTPVGPGFTKISSYSSLLAVAELDGRAVLCSCSALLDPAPVFVTDLLTRDRVATGPSMAVELRTMASTVVDGVPVLLTVADEGELTCMDLRTMSPVVPPVPTAQAFPTLSVVELGGRPCAFVGGLSNGAKAYDAGTLEEVAGWEQVSVTTAAELDGEIVGLSAYGSFLVTEPGSERPREIPAPGCVKVVTADIDGRLIGAVGDNTGAITLYDIRSGTRIGTPLTGHEAEIAQLGVVHLADRPVLVSAAADNAIRVWDMAVHAYG